MSTRNLSLLSDADLRAHHDELAASINARVGGDDDQLWIRMSDADQELAITTAQLELDELRELQAEAGKRKRLRDQAEHQASARRAVPMYDYTDPQFVDAVGGVYRPPVVLEPPRPKYMSISATASLPVGTDTTGLNFSRITKAVVLSRNNARAAAEIGSEMYGSISGLNWQAVQSAGVGASGGFLVPEEYSRDFVALLRHQSVVRPFARSITMARGNMVIPVQTGGVAANWLSENEDDLAQDATYGQRRMVAHKLRALTVASNELLRSSDPSADALIRDDLVGAVAEAENSAFLRGTGTGAQPKGIRYWAPASQVVTSTGSTVAQIEADLVSMVARMVAAMKGRQSAPRWYMPSRSFYKLFNIRDASGVALIFPEIRSTVPSLVGIPVTVSDQIPVTLTPGTNTEIMLVDMNSVIVGDTRAVEVQASDVAAYRDANNVLQSSFSRDQTCVRIITESSIVVTRDEAAHVLTGVGW